jgi:hypothetical protein
MRTAKQPQFNPSFKLCIEGDREGQQSKTRSAKQTIKKHIIQFRNKKGSIYRETKI